ncbi:MAG: CRISPR system precrRNA processing endoribonuclease RAMP protein Cas6 [Anaerolineae bacterium]
MDLLSLVLTVEAEGAGVLPSWLGRAVMAAFLGAVAERDPALAEALHGEEQGPRPYTCSTLCGIPARQGQMEVRPGVQGWLRITGLGEGLVAFLLEHLAQPSWRLTLEGVPFRVVAATADPQAHPWAGAGRMEDLAGQYLLARQEPAWRLVLRFASPVAFRTGGQTVPVPLPSLVFGSLVDRWNAFAPVRLPSEARRFGEACMGMARFQFRSQTVRGKGEVGHIGARGQVMYTVLRKDRYWASVMELLSEFAFYSGVGLLTASGMGQVRRLPLEAV